MQDDIKKIEEKMQATALQAVAVESEKLSTIDLKFIGQIASIFNSTDLFARIWLVAACSYLDGKRPIDLLEHDQNKIIDAAVNSAAQVKHG